jgi:predicted RNA binding protein YcfA (HicA-like mRNA interferase family)
MPPKVRDLERRLAAAGFERVAARGSHRKWRHPSGVVLIVSGKGGDDARPYQEEAIEQAITRSLGKS